MNSVSWWYSRSVKGKSGESLTRLCKEGKDIWALHFSAGHWCSTQTLCLSKFALLTPFCFLAIWKYYFTAHIFSPHFLLPNELFYDLHLFFHFPSGPSQIRKPLYIFFPLVFGTGDNKGCPLACWSGTLTHLAHLQLTCKSRYCRMNWRSVRCTAHSQWGATQLWAQQ